MSSLISRAALLDKFAPFGSGIGAMSYPILQMAYIAFISPNGLDSNWMFLSFVLSYLLCTCTYRKYFIWSPAAFLGMFGLPIGQLVGGLTNLLVIFSSQDKLDLLLPLVMIFSFVFSFLISSKICKYLHRTNKKFDAL
jgi:hypothetical protein